MAFEPRPETMHCFGSQVHYWTFHRDKPRTIVMVHGFRGTHHGLQQIIERLPNFRIIVPDLPGFGGSPPMTRRGHTIEGYSAFVKVFIRRLKLHKPILLGHSFGSVIVAQLAATTPGLASQLVFINPVALTQNNRLKPALELGRLYYWLTGRILPEKIGAAVLRSKLLISLGSVLMTKTSDRALRRTIHQIHRQHLGSFYNRHVLVQSYQASLEHAIAEYAPALTKIPILLIAGKADDMAPAKGQRHLKSLLPQAKLVMIPGVGHLIHYETPAQAAQAIRKFLG